MFIGIFDEDANNQQDPLRSNANNGIGMFYELFIGMFDKPTTSLLPTTNKDDQDV